MLDIFTKISYSLRSALQQFRRQKGGKVNLQKPVYVRELFDGKATIIVFGAPFNWNYAGTSREDMEAKNPGITKAIEEVMRKYDIKRAFVPKPAFNAKVVTDADLPYESLPNFFRGADADGVILTHPGDAYFLASADCLGVAIFDDRSNSLAALHCGRDAVIDRKQILGNDAECREHSSVVDAAIDQLDFMSSIAAYNSGSPKMVPYREVHDRIQAYLAAGIRPETFVHPTTDHPFAAANKLMVEYLSALPASVVTNAQAGTIDLFALVRHQLGEYGIKGITEDEFDTATSKDAEGNFLFHSNRRDKTLRNLVVIKLN
jgi:copper oxidase (laccase) domain-containing protein